MSTPGATQLSFPTRQKVLRLGIDEAGRGCVIGPLVFAAYAVAEQEREAFARLGARDSKAMSHKRRVALREKLLAFPHRHAYVLWSPQEIDSTSLGLLSKRAAARLIVELRPGTAILDAPVQPAGIPAYVAGVRALLPAPLRAIEIIAENKAEDRYPTVGAASILAKTTRDAAIRTLEQTLGPIGSGYPSDPACGRFLRRMLAERGTLPPCVRTKWSTVQRILDEWRTTGGSK